MATELRAMKNYAGHRLSPWLGHLMVSRQETARPLLTPGEVMQLPPDDELILVSGCPPIRAKKARYYEDTQFRGRVISPHQPRNIERPRDPPDDDWSKLPVQAAPPVKRKALLGERDIEQKDASADGGIRRQPELPEHEDIAPEPTSKKAEFDFVDEEPDDEVQSALQLRMQATSVARQAAMDPGDGLDL
jgi:type IV secretion system protein VirD4